MVIVTSCAAIFGVPAANVPKGIVVAVEVTPLVVVALFTVATPSPVTPAIEKESVGSTLALTAIEVVSSTANATVAVSIGVVPVSEYVVIRA